MHPSARWLPFLPILCGSLALRCAVSVDGVPSAKDTTSADSADSDQPATDTAEDVGVMTTVAKVLAPSRGNRVASTLEAAKS